MQFNKYTHTHITQGQDRGAGGEGEGEESRRSARNPRRIILLYCKLDAVWKTGSDMGGRNKNVDKKVLVQKMPTQLRISSRLF